METLWEMDMSKVDDGDGANDLNDNNFNLFESDGQICVYVDHYAGGSSSILFRRFDSNGCHVSTLAKDFTYPPSVIASDGHMLMADEHGNLAMVWLKRNVNPDSKIENVYIQVLDANLEPIKLYSFPLEDHHFLDAYEWLGMTGDVQEGNFGFSVGCWHFQGENKLSSEYHPTKCDITVTNGTEMSIACQVYDSGDFKFDTKSYTYTQAPWSGMLWAQGLDEENHIVQAFGSKANSMTHSPFLLYKRNMSGLMEQKEMLVNETLIAFDEHCFGACPVRIGENLLLILPFRFNSSDGVKFKVALFDEHKISFSRLTELWQFPSRIFPDDCQNVFGSNNANVYNFARPRFWISTNTSPKPGASVRMQDNNVANAEKTAVVYMPGSLLSAYRISLDTTPLPSNVIVSPAGDVVRMTYLEDAKCVHVSNMTSTGFTVYLRDLDGRIVHVENISPEIESTINLSGIHSGLYILSGNRCTRKIFIR